MIHDDAKIRLGFFWVVSLIDCEKHFAIGRALDPVGSL